MGRALRTLIVEDSEDDALLLVRTLEKAGFEVAFQRVDSRAALEVALDENPWDVVLADYCVPGFGGLPALELLRRRGLETPFLIVSGAIGEDLAVALMRAGANDYLLKGNLARLAPAVERELQESEVRRHWTKAEQARRESEFRYRAILDHSFQFIGLLSVEGRVLVANRTALDFIGAKEPQVLGRLFWTTPWWTHSPELQAALQAAIRRAAAGEFVRFEATHAGADGGLRTVDFSLQPVRDDSGAVALLIPEGRDITDRKLAEEALRASEERHRSLINNLPIGVYRELPEGRGRFLQANPAMVRVVGHQSEEELLATDVEDLFSNPADRRALLAQLARTGSCRNVVVMLRTKGPSPVWARIGATATRDASGRIQWIDGTVEDITEQKRLEEQLRQAQKMEAIGTLAGGVAHDFNNILTAVLGYGNLLQLELHDNPTLQAYVNEILAASEQATGLTHSLLAFSRKQVISPKLVDLTEVVRRIEKMLRRIIGEDIEFRTALCEEPLTVLADTSQMEQVLLNLVANARDAMPHGGVLSIATGETVLGDERPDTAPGRYAFVSVSDTGVGIDPQVQQRIFEPFFTTKGLGKGTGLGLSIVYGIVKQHGGDIVVTSRPGAGACFTVYLKRTTSDVTVAEPMVVSGVKGGTETILLGEDDATIRSLWKRVLEGVGYRVLEASDGSDAVLLFKANADSIQLLVLDVVMPKKNGREAYEEIRRLRPAVPVLYVSGYTADIIHQKGVFEDGLEFLSKPVSPRQLLTKVRAVLDTAGSAGSR